MGRPFTFIFIFFVLGILLSSHILTVDLPIGMFFAIFALLLLALEFLKKGSTLWLAILLMVFGVFIYQIQFPNTTTLSNYGEELPLMEIKILSMPAIRFDRIEVEGEILQLYINHEGVKIKEKTRLILRGDPSLNLEPGDVVRIKNPKLNKEFNDRGLVGYELYLRGKGILYEIGANTQQVEKIHPTTKLMPLGLSFKVKSYVEKFYDSTLQDPQGEIMKSVLFGNQGYLSPEIRSAFSKSGTAHMVAVSGLHIGILVLLLEKVLKILTVGRNKRLIVISGCIFLYGYIVGFPVSIIRAASMYVLYVLAYFLDRRYDSINCLMFIGVVTLMFNPLSLFSVSFQLSFSATLSILTLYPLINKIPMKIPQSLKGLLVVTLAAQLGTTPIIAYHFNEISIISLLVNLLIVPTLGLLLSLGLISIFLGLINQQLGALINYFTNGLLTYIYLIVETSSRFSYSSIQVEKINGMIILIYYIILVMLYYLLTSGKYLWYKESWRKDELSNNLKQY
ncbi:ComEC/Rec2 family competence protein [Alkaliphilus transvaalensis]|uniref:ComEC/Rec2 family competence protein n=1 Tax=Alkaliphilus transvaalensis TaxID=114628 RepID=UPI000479CA71|nr:ComEC/Rec2 family competence protein [Alkaliphilus transvaalensis]